MVAVRFLVESSVDIPTLQSCIVSGEQEEIKKTIKSVSIIAVALLNSLKIDIPKFFIGKSIFNYLLHNDDKSILFTYLILIFT